ncbi:MAG: hypothetical protein R6X02_15565 [Enhygromyxa sp.]
MRPTALDQAIRLLLNACAAAALLSVPGCGSDSTAEGASETPNDDDGCGGGGWFWSQQAVELEVSGTVVSLTRRGAQAIALLAEGTLVPVGGIGNAIIETLPGADLRAWAELSNGDKLAVGGAGQILRSSSGTLEWAAVDAGIDDDLLDVVADGESAVAISSSRVLLSSDAGLTWTELEPGSWTGLRRVFRAAGQIWLIGDDGQAWASSDPAGGWEPVELGTEELLDGGEAGCSECVVIIAAKLVHVRAAEGWVSYPAPEGELFTAIGDHYVTTDRALYQLSPLTGSLDQLSSFDFVPSAVVGSDEDIFVAGGGGELLHFTPEFQGCLGRPWMIDGAARTASLQGGKAPREGWARDGLYEHASVASFARFVAELLALAAPPALIQATQAAILDELEHARLCFELAAREHGSVSAGPLPLDPQTTTPAGDPVALALAVFDEGCVGETIAAAEAAIAAAETEDDDARRALEQIAADERRHAALAWRTLRWLLDSFGEPVRAALQGRLATLDGRGDEVHARMIAGLVRPLARELSRAPTTAAERC